MNRNPGPYAPSSMEESIHACEGLGTKYLLPWRLLECFRTCMEEVRRRPEIGCAVHELFAAYRDREVFPRYEGRFAPIDAAAWGGSLLIYDMEDLTAEHLAELQRRSREFGVDFCMTGPESGRGWIRSIEGHRQIDPKICVKLDKLVGEIAER